MKKIEFYMEEIKKNRKIKKKKNKMWCKKKLWKIKNLNINRKWWKKKW